MIGTAAERETLRQQAKQRIAEQAAAPVVAEKAKLDAKALEARRQRARSDDGFAWFCQTYMHQAFPVPFADYQLALTRLVSQRTLARRDEQLFKSLIGEADHAYINGESDCYEGILDIEPRDHGKTTRNTQALPLWLALNFPGSFIVVCAASKESAIGMVDAIKTTLQEDEQILADYGRQQKKGSTWSKTKLQLANGSAIVAVGAGQALRGIKNKFQRPTHIICDDLLKDDEVESATVRKKLYTWFKRVILNLGQGALTIVANTIMHPEDLPSRLLGEIKDGRLTNWIGLRFGAITPAGDALWPDRWPLAMLETKRRQLGALWYTEWMNQPISDEERIFNEAWFEYFQPRDVALRDCTIGMAVDPATGKTTGDYSAIAVVAKHRPTGLYYVLYCRGFKESDLALARRICEVYRLFRPDFIDFETVQFQAIYKREVAREGSRQGLRLPLRPFNGGNKHVRIKSLGPMFENGLILLQEDQTLLKEHLINYPRGHDDCPDALEMCISGLESTFTAGVVIGKRQVVSAAQRLAGIAQRLGGRFR